MIYGYVKDRTGPLKSGIETLEATVKTVLSPVFLKFHEAPVEFLRYVDRKVVVLWNFLSNTFPSEHACSKFLRYIQVDESVIELDRHLPPNFKKVSAQALSAAKNAPDTARTMVYEVRRAGVLDTASGLAKSIYTKCEPTAKALYAKYEPKAEQCAVSAWRKLNQLPHFRQVANAVLPGAAYCTEKYNETVRSTAEKGYRVSAYLPLVPKEKIAKIFSENENANLEQ